MYDQLLSLTQKHLVPRFQADENGIDYWLFDGQRVGNIGLNAVVGRHRSHLEKI